MAYFKQPKATGSFFKPDLNIDYKPEKWVFSIYNLDTREKTEVPSLEFYSIINLNTYAIWMQYESQIFANIFTDLIKLRDSEFKAAWVFRYDKDVKWLVDLNGKDANLWKGGTNLIIIWMLKTWESFKLKIGWFVKINLTVLNEEKTNKDKIKTLDDSVLIKLTPVEETITVGKKPMQKKIHLLDVAWDNIEIDEDTILEIEKILSTVQSELDYHQQKDDTKSVTTSETAEEIDLDDVPF